MKGEGGSRIEWDEIPSAVRAAIEADLGAAIETAHNQAGGFSPGLAARCTLADGRRVFLKAVSADQNPHSPRIHRREAEVARVLTEHAPNAIGAPLHTVIDDGHWVCLVFDDVEGRQPDHPWRLDELDVVMQALRALPELVGPHTTQQLQSFEATHRSVFEGWRRIAAGDGDAQTFGPEVVAAVDRLAALETTWADASTGDALVHSDVRADNLLLTATGEVALIDWPFGCRGAAFLDPVLMLCDIGLGGGPDPATVIDRYQLDRGVEDEFRTVLCAVLGFFVRASLDPAPPGLPRLRAFQRAQAEIGLPWLLSSLS